ncbi:MAG: hypothetical protein ACREUY_03605, partial [Burkholderiales bacterium]
MRPSLERTTRHSFLPARKDHRHSLGMVAALSGVTSNFLIALAGWCYIFMAQGGGLPGGGLRFVARGAHCMAFEELKAQIGLLL